MKTFEAEFIQYLMPDGRRKRVTTDLPIEFQSAYDSMVDSGCRFEIEMLSNGLISASIANDECDVDISITPNGPQVQVGICEMLSRRAWVNS